MDTLLADPVAGNAELPKHIVPSLPMNPEGVRWPSCFSSVRISPDGLCREVILNESAGTESGKIWKFYPSPYAQIVEKQVQELRNKSPFEGDGNLQEDLDLLGNFVAHMWSIDDGFSDHGQRRQFYEEHPEVSLYCGKISKLRKNIISYVYYAFNTIKSKISQLPQSKLNDIPRDLQKYDELDFTQKIEYAGKIDKDISDFFDSILDLAKQ